jgi:pyruvate dehydrogenase E2 component (dihydrolipoamide acetyltransferase)
MATELKLPSLGENINEGEVVRVLASEGDVIAQDQPVVEIETDKAVIEVPSSSAGRVREVRVKAGERIAVGAVMLVLEEEEEEEEEGEEAAQAPPKKKKQKEAAQPQVKEEKPEAEEPEPKAAAEEADREAEVEVVQRESYRGMRGDMLEEQEEPEEEEEEPEPAPAEEKAGPRKLAAAAPSVRRFARELGLDINQIPGSGPQGRISMDDVKEHGKKVISGAAAGAGPGVQGAPPLPDFAKWGQIRRERFSNVRAATVRHMAAAWSTIPHVTQYDQCDVTDLEETRKKYSQKAEQAGGKLTVTAIILKVTASALKVFPRFNASLDVAKGEIVYKEYFHIGVAVDTDRGLLVPVIRDVDRKNIIELAVELSRISEKARNGKLSLEEMQGGSFTVSNLGGIGGTHFAPIVNQPEVAILGVSRSSYQPVLVDGGFQPRLILPLSLSYDHRLIDGADGARFLRWVAQALEDPFLISLQG